MLGNQQNINYRILAFLINPFFAFIFTLNSSNPKLISSMLFAWCIFFGFTFAISIESSDSDIIRYIEQIDELKMLGINNLIDVYKWYFSKGEVDFYSITLIYLTYLIGGGYNTLTFLFSILFSLFLAKNIKILIELAQIEEVFIKILIVTFFMLNPVWYINGVRFYTALHILVFSVLKYLYHNKSKYLLLMLLTPLIHFSFFFGSFIVGLSLIFKNKPNIVFSFFLLSVFASELLTNEFISQVFSYFDFGVVSQRGSTYIDKEIREQYLEELGEVKVNWYMKYLDKMIRYSLTIIAFSIYFFLKKQIFNNSLTVKIFSISFFIYSIGNFLINHFVLGRFYTFGSMLLVAFFIFILKENNLRIFLKNWGWFRIIIYGTLVIVCIVVLRIGLYNLSVSSIFSNPIIALFETNFKSINDLIKF
ncbi:MAG: hypothetical protein ACK4K9_05590 [Bacteroidia bacterium]